MDRGFQEAANRFWDCRYDMLAFEGKKLYKEHDAALEALTATLSEEQARLFSAFESALNLHESNMHEFFYKKGFADAVRFLYGVLKNEREPE